ncbi:hypothetical protein K501DRAFT_285739 [Backusella circina FSU 941]|nr:hypothetical protein K501DRAFT_289102 [Backusella circina FSU 941]KAI8882716.1 hypothetical protein K501DRAFT_285739 [Backusella circina FSU 941]
MDQKKSDDDNKSTEVKKEMEGGDGIPKEKSSRTSFILAALQSSAISDEEEEDDDESLVDPNEKLERIREAEAKLSSGADSKVTDPVTAHVETNENQDKAVAATTDLEAEVEALDIASPTIKPSTYEPIPFVRPPVKPVEKAVIQEPSTITRDQIKAANSSSDSKELSTDPPMEGVSASSDITSNLDKTLDSGIAIDQHHHNTRSSTDDANVSSDDDDEREGNGLQLLGAILPAVEQSVRAISEEKAKRQERLASTEPPAQQQPDSPIEEERIPSEERERANRSREFEYSIEDPIDLDMFRDNVIAIQSVDPKSIPVNILSPREQEQADEPVREGMKFLFDNKFMKAKQVFQTNASYDPLYALGLGAMAFIKATMTYHTSDIDVAMNALVTAYTIAKTQIDNSSYKKPFKDTVGQYFSSFLSNKTGLPADPPAVTMPNTNGGLAPAGSFIPNGVLRAHVVKAECCLLMGILQMTQESVVGYLKCGLNIRRAYHSYSIVWQEYKRMGQEYTRHMDCDTVSAVQFGIGAVHLILSSMPAKILKIFSALGWKSDKQLGFALLKLCIEGRGIRSPLAALTLLAYYSILTSFAPQLYTKEMMSPAIECLMDAQRSHPNSCFFLFFAARIARVARNLPLSTQSFTFAVESSRGEWAEVAMKQMSDYEIGFNLSLQLDWEGAANYFEQLCREKYWSTVFSKYFVGACREMMGQRTEAILAFAEIPELAKQQQKQTTYIDAYVQKKVEFFQKSGYQDMDFNLPGLELLLVLNAFEYMEQSALEQCLDLVQRTLELIYEREKIEYNIRLRELVPVNTPPDYYDQRAILLLIKSSVLNSLGRYNETIAHLNWILDHKQCIKSENWIVPFTYWESGVTSWGLGNYKKSRKLWQLAMGCTKYDFEYRMAVRLSLALSKCDEVGINHINEKDIKGPSTNGRKRMPIVNAI